VIRFYEDLDFFALFESYARYIMLLLLLLFRLLFNQPSFSELLRGVVVVVMLLLGRIAVLRT